MLEYALIAASILFAAFYCGSETGLYCLNRLRLRLRVERGDAAARTLLSFVLRPRFAVTTTLVGTNIGLYVATVLFAEKLHQSGRFAHPGLYSSLIMPPILLVFAELIPKSLFQHHAEALMYRVALPLKVSHALFYPLSALLGWISLWPHALVRRRSSPRPGAVTSEAFRHYLAQSTEQGVLSASQHTMAENILHLKSTPLADVMTPLDKAVMLPEEASRLQMLSLLKAHRYSRIPVYRGQRDNVVGLVSIVDVACEEAEAGADGAPADAPLASLARGILSLRHDASVADALWAFRQARQQLAVVADREGRARGIVTLKDVVEEIVGELQDW